jgi:hypothetical protein
MGPSPSATSVPHHLHHLISIHLLQLSTITCCPLPPHLPLGVLSAAGHTHTQLECSAPLCFSYANLLFMGPPKPWPPGVYPFPKLPSAVLPLNLDNILISTLALADFSTASCVFVLFFLLDDNSWRGKHSWVLPMTLNTVLSGRPGT